jgi:NADH:ubiquinone oxidoreductase subunit 6 (subunit J)
MGLHKILKYLALALAVIGVILALMVATGSENMVDNMLYVAYAVLVIILILVSFYVVKGLFEGNIKKTLLSLGIFFGIAIVSYLMSSGTDLDLQPFINKGQDITEATSRNVGAGLYTFYALAVFAIGTMAFSGLKKMIK